MDRDLDEHRQVNGVRLRRASLVAIPAGFVLYFFAYPVASVLVAGLSTDGRLDLSTLAEVFTRPELLRVAWFTLWQAVVSTALTLLVGVPGAYALARFEFPGRRFIRAATVVPFVLPTVVVGSAFLALLGPNGPLGLDLRRSVWAILIAHVFYNYAVVVRTVGAAWERIGLRVEEAAVVLGARPLTVFRKVTLPLLRPAIASAASIVFLFTVTSFGVILILGDFRHSTVEVEIWRQATSLLNLPVAAALAVLQLAGVTAILLAYSRYQLRRSVQLVPAASTARPPATARQRLFLGANLGFMTLLLLAPLLVLVERSFRAETGYTLARYGDLAQETSLLFVRPMAAVGNSLGFALVATLIAITIGVLAATVVAYQRGRTSQWFDAILMLPLGTSAVTLGFGFLIALDAPIDLRRSIWLVPISHALIAIPFVVRTTVPVMRSIQRRLREAAAVLGASPARAWREVDLPVVARAVLVGAGFAFAVSLGEFGATTFIARPTAPTMPIAIFRFLSQPGSANFGTAMALSTVLMITTAASVLLIERFRYGEVGDF